jgi:hypothetical protein
LKKSKEGQRKDKREERELYKEAFGLYRRWFTRLFAI